MRPARRWPSWWAQSGDRDDSTRLQAGIDDARQAEYQRKMSALLASRSWRRRGGCPFGESRGARGRYCDCFFFDQRAATARRAWARRASAAAFGFSRPTSGGLGGSSGS